MLGFLFRHRTVALFGLVLLIGLGVLALGARGPGLPMDWLSPMVTPFQHATTQLHRRALALWGSYRDWRVVRSENERLRREVDTLQLNQLQLNELHWENRRLRSLLGLAERLPLKMVAAEVIAREWNGWVRSLTVNRGRADGIERLQPVIVPEGVLGRVAEVRQHSAIIQLVSDPASSVSAMTQRSRIQGIVEGGPSGQVRLKFPSLETQIEEGEPVITSGLGGVFPKGLPLGHASRVYPSATRLFRYAQVVSDVDFSRIEIVLILQGQVDLSTFFTKE